MKKNVKIARSLLKLAKELIAANPYETQIRPERMKKVWNDNYQDIIDRILLCVQLREAIAKNLPTLQSLKTELEQKIDKINQNQKESQAFIDRLMKFPTLVKRYEWINGKSDGALAKLYPRTGVNNSIMTKVENGIMEELLVLDQALQMMSALNSPTSPYSVNALAKGTGLDAKIVDKLANGMAVDFMKELDNLNKNHNTNYSVELTNTERGSYRGIDSLTQEREKYFEDNGIKDHQIRIDNVRLRLEIGKKNSLLMIQKLNATDQYLSDVLLATSFTNISYDKELVQNFNNQQGEPIPSANGGEFKTSTKTAGLVDKIVGFFKGLSENVSKIWNAVKNLFDKRAETDTTKLSQEIIDAFK